MELPGISEAKILRARTRELPDPAAGQALARVEASGVSFAMGQEPGRIAELILEMVSANARR